MAGIWEAPLPEGGKDGIPLPPPRYTKIRTASSFPLVSNSATSPLPTQSASRVKQLEKLLAASSAEVQTLRAALRQTEVRAKAKAGTLERAQAAWQTSTDENLHLLQKLAEQRAETQRLTARTKSLEEEVLRLRHITSTSSMIAGLVDGSGGQPSQAGLRVMRAMSDVVFMTENLWHRIRGSSLSALQRQPEFMQLTPRELIHASSNRIEQLQNHVQECQQLQISRSVDGGASSSLFSLLPFSSGTREVLTPMDARVGGISDDSSTVAPLDRRASLLLFSLLEEIIELRQKLNHYTEQLLSATLAKQEQFDRDQRNVKDVAIAPPPPAGIRSFEGRALRNKAKPGSSGSTQRGPGLSELSSSVDAGFLDSESDDEFAQDLYEM